MSKTHTPSHGSTPDVSFGDILVSLAADAGGQAPSEIQIAPRGRVKTRDERAFEFAPETLVARFEADGIEVPIDLEHSLSSFMGDKSKGAIGWIKGLVAKPEGLFARVEWLEAGLTALAARTHRYVSPTFRHDEFGKATWLHSAALVAAPALAMPALAAANLTEIVPMTKMARLAAQLGLTEDANEDAMIEALAVKLDGAVAKDVHTTTLAALTASNSELETLKAANRKAALDTVLEAALTAKKIVPAEREHYAKLAASDEGFDQVKALLSAMTPRFAGADLTDKGLPGATASLSADDRAVMAQLGLTEAEYRKANGLDA